MPIPAVHVAIADLPVLLPPPYTSGRLAGEAGHELSKTDFLIYRDCAHNAWVKIHAPEIYRAKPLSLFEQGLLETGNEVDGLARELFPHGVLVGVRTRRGQRGSSRNAR